MFDFHYPPHLTGVASGTETLASLSYIRIGTVAVFQAELVVQ